MVDEPLTREQQIRRLIELAMPRLPGCVPHTPHPRQAVFLHLPQREALFGGASGGGKALALDTPIPTPSGWTTMGEIEPGATVYGMDGVPTRVTGCSAVMLGNRCYRLRFDDGTEVTADAEHRWLTYSATELVALSRREPAWRAARRARRPSRVTGRRSAAFTAAVTLRNRRLPPPTLPPPTPQIRTTEELAAARRDCGGGSLHAVPVAGAIDGPDVALPIEPYALGLWLGDGNTANGGITTADPEVVEAFRASGYAVTKRSEPYAWGTHGLYRQLRLCGLLGNKHVPQAYLRASKVQRLAILQGLMDTDGCSCESGAVEFTSTLRHLADAVAELACSLGWKARVNEGRATLRGRYIGPKYRVKWTPSEKVFRLERKWRRQRTTGLRRTTRFRYVVDVEPVASVPVRCIKVDAADGMFLAGRSFVPTHNTDALLMAGLQYVDVPGYHAIAFRRTYPELVMPGGLIPRSKQWLGGTDAKWNESRHDWTFPNGAVLKFGHIQHLKDVERHERGPDYQCIVYDELTTFQEAMYVRVVGSRLRRPSSGPLSKVPLRVRAGTNPGGEGHEWVKRRFLAEGKANGRAFVPARLRDNPSLDAAAYIESLSMLDPVSLARMLEGDWEVQEGGEFFDRAWFVGEGGARVLAEAPACVQRVRFWDCAATTGDSSAYTAGCLMGRTGDGLFVILDMQRFRARPGDRDALIRATAESDGRTVPIRIEKEGGSGGVHQADDQVRMLAGWDVDVVKPLGDKPERAAPLARQAKAGNVRLVSSGPWIGPFLDECQAFPRAKLKDQVDAASGAFLHLTQFGPIASGTSARPDSATEAGAQAGGEGQAEAPRPQPRLTWSGAGDPRRGRVFRR